MKLLNTKNFWLKGVSAIAVLLICVLILPITAKADTPGTVNDNNVNIRADADATSTSLGKLQLSKKRPIPPMYFGIRLQLLRVQQVISERILLQNLLLITIRQLLQITTQQQIQQQPRLLSRM